MKRKLIVTLAGLLLLSSALFILVVKKKNTEVTTSKLVALKITDSEDEEATAEFQRQRLQYEYDLIKDPATGKVPYKMQEQELAFARKIATKGETSRVTALNTYFPAGPNSIGGRTRAVAYDKRFGTGGNQVIIAGSVSGGIMRSADGGNTWTRVSPDSEIHNLTALAQDPSSPDIWYAGGGESDGNTAAEIGAFYYGFGLYKSANNGQTWSKIAGAGSLEAFDDIYDFVHKIAVHPTNHDVYVAGHRRVMKSTNGGTSFTQIFGGAQPATSTTGQADIAITTGGKILIAGNGGNPDAALRGFFVSNTGDAGSFTRIAGGSVLGTDSVANWKANDYDGNSKRILMAVAPSNQNSVYVIYENGLSNTSPDLKPTIDFFKLDLATNTWTNRSANMPDFPGGNNSGTDPITVQGGYDMLVAVKPDDENTVFIGGSSLYRSTDGFATADYDNKLSWIGGYGRNSTTSLSIYTNSHPDMHVLVFNPSNFNEVICANDGGLQKTTNIMATANTTATLPWTMVNNYQTLQYYNVSIDPDTGDDNFMGGAQDNGTYYRDKIRLFSTPASDSNTHFKVLGGDGCYTGLTGIIGDSAQYAYCGSQLGTIYRFRFSNNPTADKITPGGLTKNGTATDEFGEFVTNFRLNPDNTDQLYYINFNRLFRVTNARTVSSSGWTELTGVAQKTNPSNPTAGTDIGIRSIAFTHGAYATSHSLYLGTTNGKIFRLDDPKNATASTAPADITPSSLTGNVQDIAVNPNDDNEILAVVSNYNTASIWWTNNAKSASPTWKNVEGNLTLPSARSCVIAVKKDALNNPVTEYYVGTSVGLYSAAGIGTGTPNWQREGGSTLNFAVIQSLAYRPVDNTLLIGTHGNGMYYTKLGTPNLVTGINDPILNDKSFIKSVYPTLANEPVKFIIGNRFEIKKLTIQVFNMAGQEMQKKETSYQNGTVDFSSYPKGAYILSILSDDKKYKHVQKIIK